MTTDIARPPRSPAVRWAGLAAFGLAVAAVATLGALAVSGTQNEYAALERPAWAPPSWLFGPVWTVLYAMIAIAGWLVWRRVGATAPSLLVARSDFGGGRHVHSEMNLVLGRSDPNEEFVALYADDRGVCRQYAMTFGGGHWTMTREDPDMHQRFIADVEDNRILGRWEASEDAGKTWRKDFDLTFERG